MAQISLPLNKGSYGHHSSGSGPQVVADIKELISSGHIFVEIGGVLVRDEHLHRGLQRLCVRRQVDLLGNRAVAAVRCAAAFFELPSRKTQRERLHLQEGAERMEREMFDDTSAAAALARDQTHVIGKHDELVTVKVGVA